jgi:virginiamycin B lyase
VGPDNGVWFTGAGAGGSTRYGIGRVSIADSSVTTYTTNGYPNQITNGPDGALWFSMGFSGQIIRTDLSGNSTASALPAGYDDPTSAAEGADHGVWFFDASSSWQLARIDTNGNVQEFFFSLESSPKYIASGPDGSLWFTDDGRNAIVRVQ